MKLITVSGPHGAGKEEIVTRLLRAFPCLSRIVPHTSRARRPSEMDGREYHFVSNEVLLEMVRRGEFVFHAQIRSHHSGTTYAELLDPRHRVAVVDITPFGATLMRNVVCQNGGRTLSFFFHASWQERKRRIAVRQPYLTDADVEWMLNNDPVHSTLERYPEFLIIPNPDGWLDETAATVIAAVRQFLAEKS